MKRLKNLIIIIIFIIIALIISIIVLLKTDKSTNQQLNKNENNDIASNTTSIPEDKDLDIKIETNKRLNYVQSRKDYFAIKSIYNKYLTFAADNNSELINVFSKEYISKYNITKDNVISYTGIKTISDARNYGVYTPMISDMMCADISNNMKLYLVYGKYILKSTGSVNSLNLMIILNTENMLYDVYNYTYMKENGYDKYTEGKSVNINPYNIQDRKTNKVNFVSVSDSEMANNYFDDWKNAYLYDSKNAYAKLNTNYANKKFGSYSKFENYITNLGYIPNINQFKTYSTKDYTDYICTDQYNNYYIFRQQGGIMRYSVFLDSYTVELDSFKQNYEEADENTKVAIQVGKFKQMLNTKDYNAIYHKLNTVFRNNNFNTVSKLENYLKNKVYDINTVEIEDFNQNNDYYVCNCILTNQKDTNEQKKMTIIIKLIDSNNFEMSFNINE